jgi:hypothetical protein
VHEGDIFGQWPVTTLHSEEKVAVRPRRRRGACQASTGLPTIVRLPLLVVLLGPANTAVAEEIRGDDLAPPGHFKFEEHVGYTTTFDPKIGTSASQQAVFGESELAYGLTEWWDIALTTPYSFSRRPPSMENGNIGLTSSYALETGGFTVRQMFLSPDREERDVYYGLMVRFGYAPPGAEFSDLFVRNKSATPGLPAFLPEAVPRYFSQMSPIVSWKFGDGYQLLFNSNFNFALGSAGSSWEPNFRFVKEIASKVQVGIEYFSDLGPIGTFVPWKQEQHRLLAVTRFTRWGYEFGLGVGYGLTPASNGVATSFHIEKDF